MQVFVIGDRNRTAAADLADAVLRVAGLAGADPLSGTFHFCNSGETTWYEFASAILEDLRTRGAKVSCQSIEPINTSDYPTLARRPAYSVLSTERYIAATGQTPRPWRHALSDVLDTLVA